MPRLAAAFVFGSFGRSAERQASDIDLLLVGDVTFAEVAQALREPQTLLSREVNPSVYTPQEFRRRMGEGHRFLRRVMDSAKLMVVGDEHELEAMAAERVANQLRLRLLNIQ